MFPKLDYCNSCVSSFLIALWQDESKIFPFEYEMLNADRLNVHQATTTKNFSDFNYG